MMHWQHSLIQAIGGWSIAIRLALAVMIGSLFLAIGTVLVDRYRYQLLYGLLAIVVLYWLVR